MSGTIIGLLAIIVVALIVIAVIGETLIATRRELAEQRTTAELAAAVAQSKLAEVLNQHEDDARELERARNAISLAERDRAQVSGQLAATRERYETLRSIVSRFLLIHGGTARAKGWLTPPNGRHAGPTQIMFTFQPADGSATLWLYDPTEQLPVASSKEL